MYFQSENRGFVFRPETGAERRAELGDANGSTPCTCIGLNVSLLATGVKW